MRKATRLPQGHPEGYLEAFANLYKEICADIRRAGTGLAPQGGYPTVADGLRGLQFVHKAVESSTLGAVWVDMPGMAVERQARSARPFSPAG